MNLRGGSGFEARPFTSADNLQAGAVLVHGLGVGLVAKVAIGIRVVEVTDVLNTLAKGRQGHGVDLEGRGQDGVLGRPVATVPLAGDAAEVSGAGESRTARKLVPVEGRVGRVELPYRKRRA